MDAFTWQDDAEVEDCAWENMCGVQEMTWRGRYARWHGVALPQSHQPDHASWSLSSKACGSLFSLGLRL